MPKITMTIEYNPENGELGASHNCVDVFQALGILEAAKDILKPKNMNVENREPSKIVKPVLAITGRI